MKKHIIFSTLLVLLILPRVNFAATFTDVTPNLDSFSFFQDNTGRFWADISEFADMTFYQQAQLAAEKSLAIASKSDIENWLGITIPDSSNSNEPHQSAGDIPWLSVDDLAIMWGDVFQLNGWLIARVADEETYLIFQEFNGIINVRYATNIGSDAVPSPLVGFLAYTDNSPTVTILPAIQILLLSD